MTIFVYLCSGLPERQYSSVTGEGITVRFGSSEQLLNHGFSFRHDSRESSRKKREKGGRRSRKARVVIKLRGMAERAATPLSICLSDPQGRHEAVAQEGA
jgi:hypothetical protein